MLERLSQMQFAPIDLGQYPADKIRVHVSGKLYDINNIKYLTASTCVSTQDVNKIRKRFGLKGFSTKGNAK